jgi:hypothetical protein
MRTWRSHPVLSAALVGGAIGLIIAVALMTTVGYMPVVTNRALLLLWPASVLGVGFLDGSRAFEAFLFMAELGSNALLYAFAFSAPVALVVAIRRSFIRPNDPTTIGRI